MTDGIALRRALEAKLPMKVKLSGVEIHAQRLLGEARDLMCEDGENPEYDRALCELIARCLPVGLETAALALLVAETIGVKSKLYEVDPAPAE